jgi:hypothetical protein
MDSNDNTPADAKRFNVGRSVRSGISTPFASLICLPWNVLRGTASPVSTKRCSAFQYSASRVACLELRTAISRGPSGVRIIISRRRVSDVLATYLPLGPFRSAALPHRFTVRGPIPTSREAWARETLSVRIFAITEITRSQVSFSFSGCARYCSSLRGTVRFSLFFGLREGCVVPGVFFRMDRFRFSMPSLCRDLLNDVNSFCFRYLRRIKDGLELCSRGATMTRLCLLRTTQ